MDQFRFHIYGGIVQPSCHHLTRLKFRIEGYNSDSADLPFADEVMTAVSVSLDCAFVLSGDLCIRVACVLCSYFVLQQLRLWSSPRYHVKTGFELWDLSIFAVAGSVLVVPWG